MSQHKDIVSVIPEVPVTKERPPPPVDVLEDKLGDAGQPRANRAVTIEHPEGNPNSPDNRTVLQQHVDFFDLDGDGFIYPTDTYVGFRKIGFNPLIAAAAVPVIHGTLSYPTQNSWLPDPFFSINISNIHRDKHGSDSETYDTEGRMVPQKLEEFFSKHDKDKDGKLTFREILTATETNKNWGDVFGYAAQKLEWTMTWLLLKDENGLLSKESARSLIDGSVFQKLAQERDKRLERKREEARRGRSGRHKQQ